jgi:ubiquinone/menaquinone biosynthesis C-methylase UbiE
MLSTGQLMTKRLRQSEEFAQTFDNSGKAIVFRFNRPERFLRLTEIARTLISCFPGNHGTEVFQALATFDLRCGTDPHHRPKAVLSTLRKLIKMGLLVEDSVESEGYNELMVPYYVRSRAIPPQVCDEVAMLGNVKPQTRILDVGTGTGHLAIYLAHTSSHVTGMDISKPFLAAARQQAASSGVPVNFVLGSGDKLVFSRKKYDLITFSQVFHWLDPICASRGIYQCLKANGRVIILDQQAVLAPTHPLKALAGYGYNDWKELQATWTERAKFYSGLFKLTMQCGRLVRFSGVRCFHQRVCFDMDYARAFFLEENLQALMPHEEHPWKVLEDSLLQRPRQALEGDMYWVVLRFAEVKQGGAFPPYKFDLAEISEIHESHPACSALRA